MGNPEEKEMSMPFSEKFGELLKPLIMNEIEDQIKEDRDSVHSRLDNLENQFEEMEKAIEILDYTEVLERIAESLRVIAAGVAISTGIE